VRLSDAEVVLIDFTGDKTEKYPLTWRARSAAARRRLEGTRDLPAQYLPTP